MFGTWALWVTKFLGPKSWDQGPQIFGTWALWVSKYSVMQDLLEGSGDLVSRLYMGLYIL